MKISTTALVGFLLFSPFFSHAQPCIDGLSGPYDCDKVDQKSRITLEEFGAQLANDIWGWTSPTTGREYATVGLFDRTAFVDITSPEHPLFIGYLPTATFGILWRDIKVIDGWAYIVAEAAGHGIQVFNLRRLESVSHADIPVLFDHDAHYTGFGSAHNIVADTANKFVYGVGSNTFAGGLHIVDVSDPTNPTYAGSSDIDGYTHDAQVVNYTGPDAAYQGRQICFAANANTITIFDVTDKNDVELISHTDYQDVGYTHQCWLTDDQRFLLANDELDEINFNINTRTIIINVEDLDSPFPIGYVDLGTTSIDHNLYIKEGLVYLSNYTSGLRIRSLIDVEQGDLPAVAHFDVFPGGQPRVFQGSWSNYPYYESGTVVATGMFSGLHVLSPRLFELDRNVVEVCGTNSALMYFNVNIPIAGTVAYSVQFDSPNAPQVFLEAGSSNGAPFANAAVFTGLGSLAPGFYNGKVIISYEGYQRELPFVLVKQGTAPVAAPQLVAPINGVILPQQQVQFQWNDPAGGYAILQLAVNADFSTIVYESEVFGSNGQFTVHVPFSETYYYWRLLKPNACGEATVSESGQFEIGLISNTANARKGKQLLHLFPNPAQGQIMLNAPASVRSLVVYDLTGRQVDAWTVQNSGTSAHAIDHLAPGTYIVREVNGTHAAKFVVR